MTKKVTELDNVHGDVDKAREACFDAFHVLWQPPWRERVSALGEDCSTQTEAENYSDVYGNMHTDPAGKNKDFLIECIRMHLLTHFSSSAGEKQKWYIKSGLKKPPQIPICQWVKKVSDLYEYLEWLPSHYYTSQCTKNTKEVVLYKQADLAELILSHMPLQW